MLPSSDNQNWFIAILPLFLARLAFLAGNSFAHCRRQLSTTLSTQYVSNLRYHVRGNNNNGTVTKFNRYNALTPIVRSICKSAVRPALAYETNQIQKTDWHGRHRRLWMAGFYRRGRDSPTSVDFQAGTSQRSR